MAVSEYTHFMTKPCSSISKGRKSETASPLKYICFRLQIQSAVNLFSPCGITQTKNQGRAFMTSTMEYWIRQSSVPKNSVHHHTDFTTSFPSQLPASQFSSETALDAEFLPVRLVLSQHEVVSPILEQLHWEGGSYWLLMPKKMPEETEIRLNSIFLMLPCLLAASKF